MRLGQRQGETKMKKTEIVTRERKDKSDRDRARRKINTETKKTEIGAEPEGRGLCLKSLSLSPPVTVLSFGARKGI